jgi:hypothetical protein
MGVHGCIVAPHARLPFKIRLVATHADAQCTLTRTRVRALSHARSRVHSSRPGDVRSAVTPFLAHAHFTATGQDYKWMLYGGCRG